MANPKNISKADIDIKLVEFQRTLGELKRERDQIPFDSYEELKTSIGMGTPGYRSRSMISEDIKLVEAEIAAWELKKAEVKKGTPGNPAKPKNLLVKEEYEKVRLEMGFQPGEHVAKVLEEVADRLEENFETIKSAFYDSPEKRQKRKIKKVGK